MEKENLQDALLKELAGLESLLVSYSGGIDSTVLALLAQEVLQDKVKCILLMHLLSREKPLMRQRRSHANSGYLLYNSLSDSRK